MMLIAESAMSHNDAAMAQTRSTSWLQHSLTLFRCRCKPLCDVLCKQRSLQLPNTMFLSWSLLTGQSHVPSVKSVNAHAYMMSLCTLVSCTMLTMVQICCISQLPIGDAYWETENWSIMINSTQSIWKYLMCAPSIMQSRCSSWMHFMTPRVRESHKFMQWILAWNHGDPCALETLFVSLTLQ